MEQGREGDEIILSALRQIDSPAIAGEQAVTSITDLNSDMVVDIVARSLNIIVDSSENKFPTTLPSNIASRHRVCTTLASKIKELGFSGECGYNQLLYPAASQIRVLLTWLVQKLPRLEENTTEEVLGASALINRRMSKSLGAWKDQPWRVPNCTNGTLLLPCSNSFSFRTVPKRSKESFWSFLSKCDEQKVYTGPSIFESNFLETSRDARFASLLESNFTDESLPDAESSKRKDFFHNSVRSMISLEKHHSNKSAESVITTGAKAIGGTIGSELMGKSLQELIASLKPDNVNINTGKVKLERGTRFAHAIEFAQDAAVPKSGGTQSAVESHSMQADGNGVMSKIASEELSRELEKEIELYRQAVGRKQAEIDGLDRNVVNVESQIRQLESEAIAASNTSQSLEKEILIKQKTLEMLPSAGENIIKLQAICGSGATRLMQLALEWESHRQPLVDKLRAINTARTKRRLLCKQMIEEMKKIREEMTTMVQDLNDKQDKNDLLLEELKKLPKNINRVLYTHRILDIIASIAKQNQEIDKITSDIRTVQKTINLSSNALQRADAVTEERIFGAVNGASADPLMVSIYRHLRTIRNSFEALINTISKIGQSDKQNRDFETKIDQEMARVSSNNFDRIKADLDAIILENTQLISNIKKLSMK